MNGSVWYGKFSIRSISARRFRLRRQKKSSATRSARKTRLPTTPPAIAPVLVDELDWEGEVFVDWSGEVVVVEGEVVVVDESASLSNLQTKKKSRKMRHAHDKIEQIHARINRIIK